MSPLAFGVLYTCSDEAQERKAFQELENVMQSVSF